MRGGGGGDGEGDIPYVAIHTHSIVKQKYIHNFVKIYVVLFSFLVVFLFH